MIEQGSTALQQTASTQTMPHDATCMAPGDETGTMLLDSLGRILSCAEPAGRLFGAPPFDLMGRWIADLIVGLLLEGRSPSYDARYLAHLCQEGGWWECGAKDIDGVPFMVELNLLQMATRSGQEIFLLKVRRLRHVRRHIGDRRAMAEAS
jgi:PAS domain-containing protein